MTGDPIDADRALAARPREPGRARATEVVDEAIALAERIGENSPIAVRLSRQLVREAAELAEADGLAAHERAREPGLRERRRDRGRHRLRREAPTRLEEHLAGRVSPPSHWRIDHVPGGPATDEMVDFPPRGDLSDARGQIVGVITPRIAPMERWRVEDLARRADVSVDTIRFYQKRRLLAPPAREGRVAWYGPEHLERLARIRELQGAGPHARADRAPARRRARRDRRAARGRGGVRGRRRRAREEFLTLPELAERAGRPARAARSGRARRPARAARPRRRGVLHDCRRRDRAAGSVACSNGACPLPELLALAREHTEATRDIAEQAVALFDEHVRAPLRASDLPDDEKAEQLVDAFRVLLPAVTALVAHHFRRVLLEVAQEHLESVGEDTSSRRSRSRGRPARRGVPLVKTDTNATRSRHRPTRRGSSKTCSTGSRRATTCSTAC